MSNEKMILVRSLGYIVPQSAILSAALVKKEEQTHSLPQLTVEANPIVVSSRVMAYYLYLAIDPKFIPAFADEPETDEEEEKPRRGRKKAEVAAVAAPKPATFMIALHEDLLEDQVETTLSKSDALQRYLADDGDNIEIVKKNFNRLAGFVAEMNAQQDAIAPEIPNAVFEDLIPSGLQADISRSNATAIEVHGDQMRKGIEKSRANYDKVIDWFRRKVLVPTVGDAEPVNVHDVPVNATARDETDETNTSLTVKILLDLVKTELTVVF